MAMKNLGTITSESFLADRVTVLGFAYSGNASAGVRIDCKSFSNDLALDLDLPATKQLIELLQEAVKFAEQGHHPSNRDTSK